MPAAATAEDADAVIALRDVHTFLGGHWVHRGITLSLARGQMLALVGGSGSGKTTLLREVAGLLAPTRGEVRVFGEPLLGGSARRTRALRQRFGVLFQQGALFSALSVFDNIAFALRELRCYDEALINDLVNLKLAMVELLPQHGRLMPAELSGGMVKRVALARALALEPELLLLDEPTAGLDPDRSAGFVRLIRTLGDELGLSVLLVTHDLGTLSALASHVAVLADQHIVGYGTLDEIMHSEHPFIRSFFTAHDDAPRHA